MMDLLNDLCTKREAPFCMRAWSIGYDALHTREWRVRFSLLVLFPFFVFRFNSFLRPPPSTSVIHAYQRDTLPESMDRKLEQVHGGMEELIIQSIDSAPGFTLDVALSSSLSEDQKPETRPNGRCSINLCGHSAL